MVARARGRTLGVDSAGEEVEREEASILVARARAEAVGSGRGVPATVEATTGSQELGVERGRERERGEGVDMVWSNQTSPSRLTQLGQGPLCNFDKSRVVSTKLSNFCLECPKIIKKYIFGKLKI